MKSLLIGRFQPFHEGHKKLVEKLIEEGRTPIIAIRRTIKSDKNPLNVRQRRVMIREALKKHIGKFRIITIPDIEEVVYGRTPGWSIREIRLDTKAEAISGTEIRENTLVNRK